MVMKMSRTVLISSVAVAVLASAGAVFAVISANDRPSPKRTAKIITAPKTTKALRNRRVHLGKANSNGQRNSQRRGAPARPNQDNLPYEPGELLVANAPSGFQAAAKTLGLTATRSTRRKGLGMTMQRLKQSRTGAAEPSIFTVRRRLQRRFPNMLVDVNQHYDLAAATSRRSAPKWKGKSWARWAMGWQNVPERYGANLSLGVIDTSVDASHPALLGKNIRFRSFHREGRKPSTSGHGTAIAAMLVGNASIDGWGGLVPGAKLFAANVFEVTKSGRTVSSLEAFMKAMDWMIVNEVQVVNLSIAGSSSQLMNAAVQKALYNNVVLVAAAGNFGRAARPAYPAAYRNVLAVTAIDRNLRSYNHANRGAYIDFAMPGVAAWTAVPGGGAYQSGTSFAAPFITALAGMELASSNKFPSLAMLTKRLSANSKDLGARGRDKTYGWGFVEYKPNCG
jgi:hypothetical protein